MNKSLWFGTLLILLSPSSWADTLSGRAALGGGAGGALGALVGSELGGKEGGVVGAAIGGAVGSAIATQGQHRDQVVVREVHPTPLPTYYYVDERYEHPHARHFCPPGQAKKGHC